MNLQELKTQYQNAIEESLDQLQTAFLLLTQLEARITNVSQNLQSFSKKLEEFITEQKTE